MRKDIRRSRDDLWPLRGSDGLTFAERKRLKDKQEKGKEHDTIY